MADHALPFSEQDVFSYLQKFILLNPLLDLYHLWWEGLRLREKVKTDIGIEDAESDDEKN
jgi:hypothetical protein